MSGLNHGFVAAVKGGAVTKDSFERSRVQISVLTKKFSFGITNNCFSSIAMQMSFTHV